METTQPDVVRQPIRLVGTDKYAAQIKFTAETLMNFGVKDAIYALVLAHKLCADMRPAHLR